MMRRFKALSPVVAVLLLVIIAAVAAVILYVWMSGYMSTAAQKATALEGLSATIDKYYFLDYDNTNNRYGTLVLVLTISNTASEKITVDTFKVHIGGEEVTPTATPSSVGVAPGRAATVVLRCDISGLTTPIGHGATVDVAVTIKGTGSETGSTYEATSAIIVTAP